MVKKILITLSILLTVTGSAIFAAKSKNISATGNVQKPIATPDKGNARDKSNSVKDPGNASERPDSLVIYFSRTGEQYTVGTIEEGNTAIIAKMIAKKTGADIFEVLPEKDNYPRTYNALTDYAKKEQNEKARPAYKGTLPNLEQYSTIYIGAPVWWGDWPMIMYTVFESNNFANKNLVPFCTHEGSGLSGFDRKLKNSAKGAKILKGLAIRGGDAQNNRAKSEKAVDEWLKSIGN